ncbi:MULTISPECIES: ABC transporter ATP-binding protein [unclassified Polaribacter]|jgi:putative ABC transport system ATP-binding protein|uniref:ABC transporter ATP-binding protein n=1 Tax=unclassified Polaribacter TaxID=196858 RepID=UPI00052CBFB2|nr:MULTISPECIES: ABC transporter ATP-binding protein [unclassified Polaribacter]KGL59878.1 macrolide-specific ABC transporter ATPase [Polaribacter sp. Hel1_33_49]PKV65785.1 putative ABC transport system ATP-binding protein [Polaribacter sp. Hel1_33_96]
MPSKKVIETKKLSRIFKNGEIEVRALTDVDMIINEGEFVAIMGASGSGKSTLLHIIGCLDSPTSGEYDLDSVRVNELNKNQLADVRNQKIGFIFQSYNLLSRTTALENVELPLIYNRTGQFSNSKELAKKALEQVGLSDRMHHKTNELSGGQQQRVAIARALVNNPALILADEPTGNLDSKSSFDIADLFVQLNNKGKTIVMITHEPEIAQFAKRMIYLRDGRIISDKMIENRSTKEFAIKELEKPVTV